MEIKGDFLGFSFGGVRSEELGFVRVSGGDRYDEDLHSEVKDVTTEVPGMDGEYYFGSTYGTKTIDIDIAFDSMTEEQFRRMRKVFGTKRIQSLVFDERPYKKYLAKIESPIQLSYICFDQPKAAWEKIQEHREEGSESITYVKTFDFNGETNRDFERKVYDGTTERIYKGEGKISFICTFPFAKSNFKVLPESGNEFYEGRESWAVSSGILSAETRTNEQIDVYSAGAINVYNAGDIPTGFRLYVPASAMESEITLSYEGAQLKLKSMEVKGSDVGVIIDTNTGLINGIASFSIDQEGNPIYTTSGNLYNEYVDSGYFFKLQPNDYNLPSTLQITGGDGFQIFYDYLYF